jgi:hypothetical protein
MLDEAFFWPLNTLDGQPVDLQNTQDVFSFHQDLCVLKTYFQL